MLSCISIFASISSLPPMLFSFHTSLIQFFKLLFAIFFNYLLFHFPIGIESCFEISIAQCLASLVPVQQFFSSRKRKLTALQSELQNVIQTITHPNVNHLEPILPINLFQQIRNLRNDQKKVIFSPNKQHDAAEFSMYPFV